MKPTLVQTEGKEVQFADPNLEKTVRKTIRKPKDPILKSDLEGLTDLLNASDKNIPDLNGIEHCIHLGRLFLTTNQVSDISPLSRLTNLEILCLGDNQIQDISPLSNLTNLQELTSRDNQISDISPLSNLSNLQVLRIITK